MLRAPTRLVIGLVGICSVVVVHLPANAAPEPSPTVAADGPAITGYALASVSDGVVTTNAPALRTLTVDGVTLRRGGLSAVSDDMLRLVGTAHAGGLRAELLVSNYSDEIGDFDSVAAARLLASPRRVERVVSALAAAVTAGGWDGVNVDLESLSRADGPGLVTLLGALRSRLPAPLTLSVDLQAATSARGYLRAGYRLPEIGAAVDVVQLMAYDLHGPGWSDAGPIGPLRWQRRALGALLTQVSVTKVDLGVAGYGYTWPGRGTGHAVGVDRARRLVARDDVAPRWHAGVGEWSARLADRTTIWWSDARSFAVRRQLAGEFGLHGLALWRLGSADPLAPPA